VAEQLESAVEKVRQLLGEAPLTWERPLPKRLYITLHRDELVGVAKKLYEDMGCRFTTATGLDIGNELEVIYHFQYDAVGLVINLRVRTPKADGTLPALTPTVPPAEWIEREIMDLLGVKFQGHPRPERLILSDDWPEGVYPLRKDVKA